MSKDPAFLFYSKDWFTDTAEYTPEEKGVYIDLLAYQHQKGSLPIDESRLSRIVSLPIDDFIPIWGIIHDNFIKDGDRLVNRKLHRLKEERSEKGRKNKLIGTFAHVLKKLDLKKSDEKELRKRFNVDELLKKDTEWNTERLTEWCLNAIAFIGNANANSISSLSWKDSFDLYLKELDEKFSELISDKEFIKEQERLNPNLDIRLSFEKAKINYWQKEEAWLKKKKSRIENIDWKKTFVNALSLSTNKVYKPKNKISGGSDGKLSI